MIEAIEAEVPFAADLLSDCVGGLSIGDMRGYLQFVADRRMERLDLPPIYGSQRQLGFIDLQDVQELSSCFERKVSAHQMGVTGYVGFDDDFRFTDLTNYRPAWLNVVTRAGWAASGAATFCQQHNSIDASAHRKSVESRH